MRRYPNPKKFILFVAGAALFAFCFPFLRSNLYKAAPLLQKVGERLALFAACSELPHESLGMLEQRFNDEIFYEDEPDISPIPRPAAESSSPQSDKKAAEDSSKAEEKPSGSSSEESLPESLPAQQESSEASSRQQAAGSESSSKPLPPEIPAAYRGDMLEEDLSGYDSKNYLPLQPGYLRNFTDYSYDDIADILSVPPSFSLGGSEQPQVLIYHTHATEAFERYDQLFYDTRNNWRSTDNNMNMVAVGDALAAAMEAEGIHVLHDSTQHDYPSYNGAYERSAETVNRYLEEYPSIQIILDVHRDAIDRNGTLIRPVTTIEGKKAAQLMIISGCDDGTMNMPNWRENLRFAAVLQRQAEQELPGLMRPLFFAYRKYNQDLRPGALLLEFGSHGNTLEECIYTAQLFGGSFARAIRQLVS
ncbi:MAG: stage II sporulation protein P [Provencibacterium sp.]|nr:stage II sporulation protein P [Provencibacterium sp.]